MSKRALRLLPALIVLMGVSIAWGIRVAPRTQPDTMSSLAADARNPPSTLNSFQAFPETSKTDDGTFPSIDTEKGIRFIAEPEPREYRITVRFEGRWAQALSVWWFEERRCAFQFGVCWKHVGGKWKKADAASVFAHMGNERGTVRREMEVANRPILITSHYRDGGRNPRYRWRQSRLVVQRDNQPRTDTYIASRGDGHRMTVVVEETR
jgi:hypothetical protein